MSKIFSIIEDLNLCYSVKAPTVQDYEKLSYGEQSDLCKGVRQELIKYVNSSEYNFKDIASNLLEEYSRKLIF